MRRRSVRPSSIRVPTLMGLSVIPLVFLVIFFFIPVAEMIRRGFVPDGYLDFSAVAEVLSKPRTIRVIWQTTTQALAGTIISIILGIPGAYLLYRVSWRGRGIARAIVSVPFVLPTVVVGVAFRTLIAESGPLGFLGLDGTFTAIVLALVFFNYSVVVRTVGTLWARLDPRAAEAAAVLGARPTRVFFTVTIPALMPAIASAGAMVFLYCATAYGVVMILGGLTRGTIESEIYLQTVQFGDLRAAAVLSVVQIFLVAAALWAAARARSASERSQALHTSAVRPLRLRGPGTGPNRLALGVTLAVVGGLLLGPMANLAIRSFRVGGEWSLQYYRSLFTTTDVMGISVMEALGNSLRIAVMAASIAVGLGVLVSVVAASRGRTPTGRAALSIFDAAFMLPLGVSSVTVGFGFLLALDRPPLDLRSSSILVPIAQAVVALPMVVRMVLPVLRAIDPRQREAASMMGASPLRVWLTVDGPFLVRSLGLAIGFAFTISLGEFGATSFLARPDSATLPVMIYRLFGRPGAENFGMAVAACVILAALTATVMALAERMRADNQGGW